MARQPPGPKGEQLGRLNAEFCRTDIFGFLRKLAEHYGDVAAFDLGTRPYVFVSGAAQVHELFARFEPCLRKPEFIKDSNRGYWGDGLTTLEGPAWQSRRRLLGSCFRPEFLAHHLSIVSACTGDMMDRWAAGSQADLADDLRVLTARIAVKTVLGVELDGFAAADESRTTVPFSEAYGEPYVGARGGDATASLVVVRPRAPRSLDTIIGVIDGRIANAGEGKDVLSQLVRACASEDGGLAREDLIGEVVQMLYAGHHTIPTTMARFWCDIAAHDGGERIAAEGNELCTAGLPGTNEISDSYCLAALKESMRLHPANPILYREVEREFELDGFEFAREVGVWVSPQLLHDDPRNFPQPHRFIPERFVRGNSMFNARAPHLPFGAGRRVCIANHLSLQQMSLIALLTARRFQFVVDRSDDDSFALHRVARTV